MDCRNSGLESRWPRFVGLVFWLSIMIASLALAAVQIRKRAHFETGRLCFLSRMRFEAATWC